MALYAYNKKGTAQVIPIVNITVPPSLSPPSRGPAYNVTSELEGLSNASYTAIQAKVTDGTFDFEWTGAVEYETPGLATSRPSSDGSVELSDESGAPVGTVSNPLHIDPTGDTTQPVSATGTLDTYLACSGVVTLGGDVGGGVGDETPILALYKPGSSFRPGVLRFIDVYVAGNGSNHDSGLYHLDLELMTGAPVGEAQGIVTLGDVPASAAEFRAVVPTQVPNTGALLYSIPLPASHTGRLRLDLGGAFVRPVAFDESLDGGVSLKAVCHEALQDKVRISATAVWSEN